MCAWLVDAQSVPGEVHVVPVGDLIDHTAQGCVCGPRDDAVKRLDGSVGWVTVHHSLDGREHTEHHHTTGHDGA